LKLADMHRLVARKEGVETWQALKQQLSGPSQTVNRPAFRALLLAAEPQLLVRNIGASCDFFTTLERREICLNREDSQIG
jgi:hypothetical protein